MYATRREWLENLRRLRKKKEQELKEVEEKKKKELDEAIKTKTVELLKMANARSSGALQKEIERARIGGKAGRELTYDDCLSCLLSVDQREYRRKHTNLNNKYLVSAIA